MHLELAKTLRNYDRKNLSKDILTGHHQMSDSYVSLIVENTVKNQMR